MIIGFAGCAGAGKDTAADVLVRNFGFVKVALADPMKRAAREWFGWDEDVLWGSSDKRAYVDPVFGFTARHALQQLGTEVGRRLHPDVWVEHTMRVAETLVVASGWRYTPTGGLERTTREARNPGVVISDVRFPNEVAAIQSAGGHVVRLLRNSRTKRWWQLWVRVHASERQLDEVPPQLFAAVIDNRKMALRDFQNDVSRLTIRQLKVPR